MSQSRHQRRSGDAPFTPTYNGGDTALPKKKQAVAYETLTGEPPEKGSVARVIVHHDHPNRTQVREYENQGPARLRRAVAEAKSAAAVERAEKGGAATTKQKIQRALTPEFLSPSQVAAVLGINVKTLKRWTDAKRPLGGFVAAEVGYGYRYLRQALTVAPILSPV
jgi:DNA-binding transcriptional regulator YiaG